MDETNKDNFFSMKKGSEISKQEYEDKLRRRFDDLGQIINETIIEFVIIILVILTLGIILLLRKKRRTDKSLIHCFFRPIDYIMLDLEETIPSRS